MLSEVSVGVKNWNSGHANLTSNAMCVTMALRGTAMEKAFSPLTRENLRISKKKWLGKLGKDHLQTLASLTRNYGFMVALGDLLLLNGNWYVTHAGLLRLAQRRHCNFATRRQAAGCSRQRSTNVQEHQGS
jgi:hypothetical protein